MPNRRQRSEQADDAAGRDRARADVKNVGAPYLRRAHCANRNRPRRQHRRHSRSEKLDRGNQNKIREHAAGAHDRSDARPDDVADPEQRRRDLSRDRTRLEGRAKDFLRRVLPAFEAGHQHLIKKADAQSGEDRFRSHLF